MVNFLTPPGFEGLLELNNKGVDIRPTLLRVLTDQYLQTPVHSLEEEQRYTELATRLIDETDIATRTTVAARLAPHAFAPRSIILQLARDMPDIAEPVLLHSPLLTPADCEAIVAERGAVYAEILTRRGKVPLKPPVQAKVESPKPVPANAPAPEPEPETEPPSPADADAYELCELFYAAGGSERRLILLNLDFAPWPVEAPPAPLQRADVWRMETAALRHNTPSVTQEIERALGVSNQQARRIVEDDQGEPIVAAAKAMHLPADVLQRILLFMNPRVGQSVDRVYELAALYSEISVDAARRLVGIMRAAEPPARQPEDTLAVYTAMQTARRALSELGARSARKPQAPTLRRTAGRTF